MAGYFLKVKGKALFFFPVEYRHQIAPAIFSINFI